MKIVNKQSQILFISLFLFMLQGILIDGLKISTTSKFNAAEDVFQDYFTIQKFYPGQDPKKFFTENELDSSLKYLVLNRDVIMVTNTLEEISKVEGIINY